MSPFYVFLNFFDIFGKIITKFITEAKSLVVNINMKLIEQTRMAILHLKLRCMMLKTIK